MFNNLISKNNLLEAPGAIKPTKYILLLAKTSDFGFESSEESEQFGHSPSLIHDVTIYSKNDKAVTLLIARRHGEYIDHTELIRRVI